MTKIQAVVITLKLSDGVHGAESTTLTLALKAYVAPFEGREVDPRSSIGDARMILAALEDVQHGRHNYDNVARHAWVEDQTIVRRHGK